MVGEYDVPHEARYWTIDKLRSQIDACKAEMTQSMQLDGKLDMEAMMSYCAQLERNIMLKKVLQSTAEAIKQTDSRKIGRVLTKKWEWIHQQLYTGDDRPPPAAQCTDPEHIETSVPRPGFQALNKALPRLDLNSARTIDDCRVASELLWETKEKLAGLETDAWLHQTTVDNHEEAIRELQKEIEDRRNEIQSHTRSLQELQKEIADAKELVQERVKACGKARGSFFDFLSPLGSACMLATWRAIQRYDAPPTRIVSPALQAPTRENTATPASGSMDVDGDTSQEPEESCGTCLRRIRSEFQTSPLTPGPGNYFDWVRCPACDQLFEYEMDRVLISEGVMVETPAAFAASSDASMETAPEEDPVDWWLQAAADEADAAQAAFDDDVDMETSSSTAFTPSQTSALEDTVFRWPLPSLTPLKPLVSRVIGLVPSFLIQRDGVIGSAGAPVVPVTAHDEGVDGEMMRLDTPSSPIGPPTYSFDDPAEVDCAPFSVLQVRNLDCRSPVPAGSRAAQISPTRLILPDVLSPFHPF